MKARVRPRTEFGDRILESKARRVTGAYRKSAEFKDLVRDMVRTMRAAKGVGLAAPQVGVPVCVAVIEARATPERPEERPIALQVVVNPRITAYHGTPRERWEGCLSFHKVFGKVPRYPSITVEYEDEEGVRHVRTVRGLLAHIFQHEVDHLAGIRFTDRLERPGTLVTAAEYRKHKAKKRSR